MAPAAASACPVCQFPLPQSALSEEALCLRCGYMAPSQPARSSEKAPTASAGVLDLRAINRAIEAAEDRNAHAQNGTQTMHLALTHRAFHAAGLNPPDEPIQGVSLQMTRSGRFMQWSGYVLIAVAAVVLSGLLVGAAGEWGPGPLLPAMLVLAAGGVFGGLLIARARRRHHVLIVATSRRSFEVAAPRHELDRIVQALRVEGQVPEEH